MSTSQHTEHAPPAMAARRFFHTGWLTQERIVLLLLAVLGMLGIRSIDTNARLPEILTLSDRILVMRQGRVVEEFAPEAATEDKIMYAAVH
ncbi:hypothetical protein VLK31_24870 [Variovorax sp. H27-G14]|uniref:hypothetical protein n=1 Tax=Variovorax sp. H27-G14 TaxID=3111914 RepID=UPI0038FCEE9B